MKPIKDFSNKIKLQLDKKQDELQRWAAEMGGNDGKTAVAGFDNFIYVKMDDKVLPVFNNRVSVVSGKKIWVGYATEERTLFQVLSTRSESPSGAQGSFAGYAPASRYRWGGADPLPVELRAFMPLRIGASKTGGLNVDLYRGYVHNGTDRFYIPRQDLDVSAHVPTTAGKAAFVLITVDDTGTVIQTKGAEVDIVDLARADVPATPANTIFESGAVRVYYGQITPQDATVNTDFVDLRFSGYSAGGYTPPVTDAANDFQVGDGAGAWIKKTLAEISTILQTSLDGVYTKLSSMSAANAALLVGGGATILHKHDMSTNDNDAVKRLVNYYTVPLEHWTTAGADDIAWTGWASYTGFVTPSYTVRNNSKMTIAHSSVPVRAFYHRPYINADKYLITRIAQNGYTECGLMVDDGVGNADGLGANNFYRVFAERAGSDVALVNICLEHRAGGGAVTKSTLMTGLPPNFFSGISLRYGGGTRWTSWSAYLYLYGEMGTLYVAELAGLTWKPARHGLFFAQKVGTLRPGIFDWFTEV